MVKKPKLCLPEELLGIKPKRIEWHHGTCYVCDKRFALVVHFNYDRQLSKKNQGFCVCKECLRESIFPREEK